MIMTGILLLNTTPVHAYVDPSIMTYTIQAVAGIVIASATFIGVLYRRARRKLFANTKYADKHYAKQEEDALLFAENDEEALRKLQQKAQAYSGDTAEAADDAPVRRGQPLGWKRRLVMTVLPALFLTVTAALYIPSSLYLSNISEFKIEFARVFPLIAEFSLAAFIGLTAFGMILNDTAVRIYAAVLMALGLGVYLQGNFMNPYLPTFNGLAVPWENYADSIRLSNIVWGGLLIGLPVLSFLLKKKYEKVQGLLCILLSLMQAVSLVVAASTAKIAKVGDFYFTRNKEFEISKTQNTIVIVLDTLDGQWFEDLFLHNNDLNVNLKDFTYFDNAIAGGAPTALGLTYMISGVEYDLAYTNNEMYYRAAMEETTLLRDLKQAGVSTRLYTPQINTFLTVDTDLIENTAENTLVYDVADRRSYLKYLYKIAAYFEAPMQLKKRFAIWENPLEQYTSVSGGAGPIYKMDDPQFYTDFKTEHWNPTYDNPVFTVYHLFGAHPPYHMNSDAQRIPTSSRVEDHIGQMFGCYKICTEMLQELKDIGMYDSSTIIITADHGGLNYFQNPAILIKKPNVTQDVIAVNHAPVTFKNLYNSFAEAALPDASAYGETLFDVDENLVIPRKHAVNCLNVTRVTFPEEELFQRKNTVVVTFYGDAKDIENVSYSEETSN